MLRRKADDSEDPCATFKRARPLTHGLFDCCRCALRQRRGKESGVKPVLVQFFRAARALGSATNYRLLCAATLPVSPLPLCSERRRWHVKRTAKHAVWTGRGSEVRGLCTRGVGLTLRARQGLVLDCGLPRSWS